MPRNGRSCVCQKPCCNDVVDSPPEQPQSAAAAASSSSSASVAEGPLMPGEEREFTTQAHREWDRTGFVIERGATYRLTYVGGRWRDAEKDPCGPEGQRAQGTDVRRALVRGG